MKRSEKNDFVLKMKNELKNSASVIVAHYDGLSVLEHNHQTIDEDGLHSETDKGTSNLKDWNFQFRAFDNRGGGLICGFVKKG